MMVYRIGQWPLLGKRQLMRGVLALGSAVLISGQPKAPASSSPRSTAQKANTSAPRTGIQVPPVKYLTTPMDGEIPNLGRNFVGHDIAAVFKSIERSPALREKSEFESTATFRNRRSRFATQPLFGSMMPTGLFAFVIEESAGAPELTYDADKMAMKIQVDGRPVDFILPSPVALPDADDNAKLDVISTHRTNPDRETYIGSNAFGAKARVESTYFEEFGVAFERTSWLFPSALGSDRTFQYGLEMPIDKAQSIKKYLKLLLLCHLKDPWIRTNVRGHDPTVTEPYKTLVGENYLQIVLEELWLFDSRTGEVILKLVPSESN